MLLYNTILLTVFLKEGVNTLEKGIRGNFTDYKSVYYLQYIHHIPYLHNSHPRLKFYKGVKNE